MAATSTAGAEAPLTAAVEVEESPHLKGLSLSQEQADALLRKYLPESGGCIGLERIKLGFNNMSFVARAHNGKEYVLRATKESWPAEKVTCEMACVQLMHDVTPLPVPTIISYDASAVEFGCRWILMEKMPGRVMEAVEFEALPEHLQAKLTEQMVGFLWQLQQLRFDTTGSFYPLEGGQGLQAVRVGPYFEGSHGPFSSSQAFVGGMLLFAATQAETKAALCCLKPYAARARALLAKIEEKAVVLPDIPLVAFHGDFSYRNMLVEGEGEDLRICALLDWEWGGVKPAYCEWTSCSFGDVNAASSARFNAECERQGVLGPTTMPGYEAYRAIDELSEALNPWVVGCFGPDKDQAALEESIASCEKLLQQFDV